MVDRRHDHGEHSDTKELHEHCIHILKGCMAIDISISNCRECSDYPVNGSDVLSFLWLLLLFREMLVDPATLVVRVLNDILGVITNLQPYAGNYVHRKTQIHDHASAEINFRLGLLAQFQTIDEGVDQIVLQYAQEVHIMIHTKDFAQVSVFNVVVIV